jgi:hypothetical protein
VGIRDEIAREIGARKRGSDSGERFLI